MTNPSKYIAILATLDTKGLEAGFIRDIIANRGHIPVVIDTGIRGQPALVPSITRQSVAEASGTTLDNILVNNDKNAAISAMARGAATIVSQLHSDNRLDGVIGLGGVQGTVISTTAMQSLPIGVPKFVLSTVANGQTTFGPFVGTKDIAIMHSVADILGLNILTRQVMAEAAGAIIGMVETMIGPQHADRATIAVTMAGVTTPAAMRARELLEAWGYEVIAFHCNGFGAKAMEELADSGKVQGILDLSPHDIGGYLRDGLMKCSPDRLQAPIRRQVPVVFVPGGLDFTLYGPLNSIPQEVLQRRHVAHNPIHTHVRASQEEMRLTGRFVAERLIHASGPAAVVIPNGGFSQLNFPEGPLYDPDADHGFVQGIQEGLQGSETVQVIELNLHINDPAFAEAVSIMLRDMMSSQNPRSLNAN